MSLEDRWRSLVLRCARACNRAPTNIAVYSSSRSVQQQLQALTLEGAAVILALSETATCSPNGQLRDELDRKRVLEYLRRSRDSNLQLSAGARAALSAVKYIAGAATIRRGAYGTGPYAGKVRRRCGASSSDRPKKRPKPRQQLIKIPPSLSDPGPTVRYGEATLFADQLRCFWRNAAERQRIFGLWRQGKNGPPHSTWTSDPVFAEVKICNVFRFQDRATVWLLARVLGPLAEHDRPGDVLFNAIIFRSYLTWEQSMGAMCRTDEQATTKHGGANIQCVPAAGFSINGFEARLYETLGKLGKLNQRPYLVRPIAKRRGQHTHLGIAVGPDPPTEVKPHRYAAFFGFIATRVEGLMAELLSSCNGCSITSRQESSGRTFDCILALMKEWTGEAWSFVTYQICIDIGYVYPELFDESSWVFVGATGASGGLAWLFADRGGLSDEECVRLLETHQEQMMDQAGVDAATRVKLFADVLHSPAASSNSWLNLMALEGWLCETNK